MKRLKFFPDFILLIFSLVIINIIGCSDSTSGLGFNSSRFSLIKAAYYHSLAYQNSGQIWAMGNNSSGELGLEPDQGSSTPVSSWNLGAIKAIECGMYHNLILLERGSLTAWGSNTSSQLARDTHTLESSAKPLKVPLLANIIQIGCGSSHNIALMSDGTVWAWGFSYNGRLGLIPVFSDNMTPRQITDLSDIKSISAGKIGHNFAIANDGTAWAWGMNEVGQLGVGSNADVLVPIKISGLSNIKDIQAGEYHSIFLLNDGTVWASGANSIGQLGNSSTNSSNVPIKIENLNNVSQIICGGYYSFAIKNDGTVWAWGYNGYGQFGNGTTTSSSEPVYIENISDFIKISAGFGHNLMIKSDGTVWVWGRGSHGQLGLEFTDNISVPTQNLNFTP